MNRCVAWLLTWYILVSAGVALAGTDCRKTEISPQELARASEVAVNTYTELEKRNQPVALVARVGKNLEKYGLKYSHVGFVLRDHPDGRWTVIHLLNQCGTDHSGLFAEGLVNFYIDDLLNFDTKIIWLAPEKAEQLVKMLNSSAIFQLHQPRYNIIARPGSMEYQNSTAWVLEVLVEALSGDPQKVTRADAHLHAQQLGFQPDKLQISSGKRILGGMFAANVAFDDHPRETRVSGKYPVVTVRSIFRLVREQHWIQEEKVVGANPTDISE